MESWPLLAFIEMFHTGAWIFSDVFSLVRKLEDAVQTSQFSIDRRSFHRPHCISLQQLPAPIIVVFHDDPLINFRQFTVPKIRWQILQKHLVDDLAFWRKR